MFVQAYLENGASGRRASTMQQLALLCGLLAIGCGDSSGGGAAGAAGAGGAGADTGVTDTGTGTGTDTGAGGGHIEHPGDCPTAEFWERCESLDSLTDSFDRIIGAEECESRAGRETTCEESQVCATFKCVPKYTDISDSCTRSQVSIGRDIRESFSTDGLGSTCQEPGGETSYSVYVRRDSEGVLDRYFASSPSGGVHAECRPPELAGMALVRTECDYQSRPTWGDWWHNEAVTHPQLESPLYTGDSGVIVVDGVTYRITVGKAESRIHQAPSEGDGVASSAFQILVEREL